MKQVICINYDYYELPAGTNLTVLMKVFGGARRLHHGRGPDGREYFTRDNAPLVEIKNIPATRIKDAPKTEDKAV